MDATPARSTSNRTYSDPNSPCLAWNFGDIKPVGEGVSELRVDYGPGYRVYLLRKGSTLVLLLGGGTKKTQQSDIAKAKLLAKEAADGN